MSQSKFVPSIVLIATTSVTIVLLAIMLLATGSFGPLVGEWKAAAGVLRAVLLLAATFCSVATTIMVLKYHRYPESIDGRWILRSTTGAIVFLVAAWILAAVLRS